AASQKRGRPRVVDRDDRGVDGVEVDGAGQPERLVVAGLRRARQAWPAGLFLALVLPRQDRNDDDGPCPGALTRLAPGFCAGPAAFVGATGQSVALAFF